MLISWMHYTTYNGAEYSMDWKGDSQSTLLSGWTSDTGKYKLKLKHLGANIARQQAMIVKASEQWKMKEILGKELAQCATARVEEEKDLSPTNLFLFSNSTVPDSSNVFATQLVFDRSFQIEIEFTGRLERQSNDLKAFNLMASSLKTSDVKAPNLVASDQSLQFSSEFNARFDEFFANAHPVLGTKNMSKVALSNLLGGISYFYGRGIVYEWVEGVRKLKETEPFELLTDTPSRTTFPRGFLWDSGFHNLVIQKWNPYVSLRILANWAERIDQNGWVAREQIPGEEARSRVSMEYWPQNPKFANPPSLLLPLHELATLSHKNSDVMRLIELLLPHFERNILWFTRTQHGNPHPALGTRSLSGLYRWRGRSRHHTLTSGLDDYPRGFVPNEYELHTDLASWMAFASRTMKRLKELVGQGHDNELAQLERDALDVIEKVHWNENIGCYQDRTIDDKVSPDSLHLGRLFDIVEDEERLWTPLKLNYMQNACPINERAASIYTRLRTNIINNMTKQYIQSGFIWEQYDDVDGHGKRSYPFTGWSALVTLIITEQYPAAIKA